MLHFFFGFSGRVTRRSYLFGLIAAGLIPILAVAAFLVAGGFDALTPNADQFGQFVLSPAERLAVAIANFLSCWAIIALYSRRINDFNEKYEQKFARLKPIVFLFFAGYHLLLVLSIVALGEPPKNTSMLGGIFIGLALLPLFVRSERGPNRHGPDPRDPEARPYEVAPSAQALAVPSNSVRMKEMARSGAASAIGARPLPDKVVFGRR